MPNKVKSEVGLGVEMIRDEDVSIREHQMNKRLLE